MRRMAFKNSLGDALSIVEKEIGEVERLLASARLPREEKTLDGIRAKLKSIARDLAYSTSTLDKMAMHIATRVAFVSGGFKTGGGIIRPDGSSIPVEFTGHAETAAEEAIEKGLITEEDADNERKAFDALKKRGYVIVHRGYNSGWMIEYYDRTVSRTALRELCDYFITHREHKFMISNERDLEDIDSIETLEAVFKL